MPADTTDINKMPMPGGGVNSPASGTYGEGAALERLKAQLPAAPVGAAPSAADPSAPMPTPAAGPPAAAPPAGGLPAELLAPTQRPNVPVGTALDMGSAPPSAMSGRQRRMAILDALANSPEVADETRELAQLLIERLIAGSAR